MKRKILILFSIVFIFFISSCKQGNNNAKNNEVKVMFSWNPGPENAFMFYGIEQGIFDSLGIKITWLPSKGSSIVATALANNEVDFGFISSDYILVSKSKDFPLKAVLTLYHETPVVIYSLKEAGIDSVYKLKGKKLGVLNKSAVYPQVISYLSFKGLNKEDYVEVFSKGSFQELILKQVDAMMQYTNYGPPEMKAKANMEVNEIKLSKEIDMYGTSIAVSEFFMETNPLIAEKFVLGLLISIERAKNSHLQVLQALLKADSNLDSLEMHYALLRTEEMIYSKITDSLGVGYMSKTGWDKTLYQMNRLNSEKIKVNVENVFSSKYIDLYHEIKK